MNFTVRFFGTEYRPIARGS